jgi:caffeoyl-CoA O-methyltransferase
MKLKFMDFLPEGIDNYSTQFTQSESELLSELNRETHVKMLIPRMLSGHMQGRIISAISHMMRPKNILEIGTYTGYSALCFAEGLAENGKITTIDLNEELEPMVTKYFEKSKYTNQIDFKIGNAIDIIPTLSGPFDLVFIDADKENYSNYFDLIIDKVPSGGFILADNVLWSGNVLKVEKDMDKNTIAIHNFNEKVHLDPRVENVLFPIRDGIMVLRKI